MREMIPKKIGKIDFALMGPKEVRKLSATKVITADTYDDDGFPIPMGLMDLHMGVIEPAAADKVVVTAIAARSTSTAAKADPTLNPYHPNQRINTPSAPATIELPGIT